MKKLVPALLLSLFASVALAQTNGVPPEQAPAGNPGKIVTKKSAAKAATDTPAATDATATTTTTDKRAARKAKRAAKVGDKPIN